MIPAGLLREVFVVERRQTATRNTVGEVVDSTNWDTVATIYGSYQALAYIETEQRAKVAGSISAVVRTRYLPGLAGGMRLRWKSRGDRLLYISAVVEQGNRDELELTVEEQVA
jgi:head-tail adaptor